jgi:DNA processing protein
MDKYDLWLSRTTISSKKKLELYREFESSEKLWYFIFNNCNNNYKNDAIINKLKTSWNDTELSSICSIIEKNHIKTVKIDETLYPTMLSSIGDAPFLLFYKGNIERLKSAISVAVVGSRNATIYGRNASALISKTLARSGINVVSGMAKGIDTYAHKSSIDNNGYTCAVLGCGIDIIYPKENSLLYDELCSKGCIISEFIPGTQPLPYNFPIRNRIISGLCEIVIVVEAGLKSGSLITSSSATEQGRDVMAVPGSIFSDESIGTNMLIKDGAYPLTCVKDIFDILKVDYIPNSITSFNNTQKKLFNIIKDTPVHIDDIIKLTNIDIKQLYELLFELQLKNEILCLAGNYYVRSCDKL